MSKLRIVYKKSVIGYAKNQKAAVAALGLSRLGQSVIKPDNPAIRGMICTVRHLVEVEEVADEVMA